MILNLLKLVLLLLAAGFMISQDERPDPEQMIEKIRLNFSTIHDFTAEVEIEINVDFINIPTKSAKVIYKYPDRLKFKSNSFIMIPRKGIGVLVFELLEGEYSAIYIGKKIIKERELSEIKVIPLTDRSDIAIATLYIDPNEDLIYYLEATTRKSGFFTSEFEYGINSPLPEINRIRFEMDKVGFPLKFLGNVNIEKSKIEEGVMGEVILRYRHYEINQGLEETLFEEETDGEERNGY
jgi:hypothetical protein